MTALGALSRLEGVWRLERRIIHDDGREDWYDGDARFERSGPRLIHDEDGWLTPSHGSTPLKATRRYIWAITGDRVEVSFHDMRPFHSFPLNAAAPSATHLCPPDRYEVTYDFSAATEWRSVWRVDGPRKAYEMVSLFSRTGV